MSLDPREVTVAELLDRLAAREPTPGGGAVAALHVALGAALAGMVARYTTGRHHQDVAGVVAELTEQADDLRAAALGLVIADQDAFGAVGAAYALSREDPRRPGAIAAAQLGAAAPPAAVVSLTTRLLDLLEALLPIGNPNVVSDVAVAADAARAAATSARVNVEVNLPGLIAAEQVRLREVLAAVAGVVTRADAVAAEARNRLAG